MFYPPSEELSNTMLRYIANRVKVANVEDLRADCDLLTVLGGPIQEKYRGMANHFAATAEQVGLDPDFRNKSFDKQWQDVNAVGRQMSTPPLPLATSIDLLGMDPDHPYLDATNDTGIKIPLEEYQVTGVASALTMMASPLHFGMLCDDVGLGKTRQTLVLILTMVRLVQQDPRFTTERMKTPLEYDEMSFVEKKKFLENRAEKLADQFPPIDWPLPKG